jgi:hypothetical protein
MLLLLLHVSQTLSAEVGKLMKAAAAAGEVEAIKAQVAGANAAADAAEAELAQVDEVSTTHLFCLV